MKKMRAWNGGDAVPNERTRFGCVGGRARTIQRERFDPLGVKIDITMIVASETLEEFGEDALRTVPAVHER